jgi:hypothetical protein
MTEWERQVSILNEIRNYRNFPDMGSLRMGMYVGRNAGRPYMCNDSVVVP